MECWCSSWTEILVDMNSVFLDSDTADLRFYCFQTRTLLVFLDSDSDSEFGGVSRQGRDSLWCISLPPGVNSREWPTSTDTHCTQSKNSVFMTTWVWQNSSFKGSSQLYSLVYFTVCWRCQCYFLWLLVRPQYCRHRSSLLLPNWSIFANAASAADAANAFSWESPNKVH